MKKTFPLHAPGKADQRVVESVKSEIRKYVKRERRKPVPAGADFWDFNCKVGATQETAATKLLADISKAIDDVVKSGGQHVYVEVLAVPGHHPKRDLTAPLLPV